jgi:hypothetical protein
MAFFNILNWNSEHFVGDGWQSQCQRALKVCRSAYMIANANRP